MPEAPSYPGLAPSLFISSTPSPLLPPPPSSSFTLAHGGSGPCVAHHGSHCPSQWHWTRHSTPLSLSYHSCRMGFPGHSVVYSGTEDTFLTEWCSNVLFSESCLPISLGDLPPPQSIWFWRSSPIRPPVLQPQPCHLNLRAFAHASSVLEGPWPTLIYPLGPTMGMGEPSYGGVLAQPPLPTCTAVGTCQPSHLCL